MFHNVVRDLTLTSPIADAEFSTVQGGAYQEDKALLAVARALLIPRGASLGIDIDQLSLSDIDGDRLGDIAKKRFEFKESWFSIINLRGDDDEVSAFIGEMMKVDSGFEFKELTSKRMSVFCGGKKESPTGVWIWLNEEYHQALVCVQSLSVLKLHIITSGLSNYLPWAFKENPLTQEEKELLFSLVDPKKSVMDFTHCIENLSKQFDMQDAAKRFYLAGFESRGIERQKEDLESRSASLVRRIRDYAKAIDDAYNEKNGIDMTLSALRTKSTRDELMEYFLSNKKLYVKELNGDTITYFVSGFCDNWDPDTYDDCVGNPDSTINESFYDTSGRFTDTKDEYDMLLKAIFEDEIIKIKMVSCWTIGSGAYARPVQDFEIPTAFEDCLPNPHLQYYGCMGSWQQELDRAADNYNYIMAVDTTSFENGNINWNDGAVVPKFMRDVLRAKNKCFVLPDGTQVTNKEAVEWLKAQAE